VGLTAEEFQREVHKEIDDLLTEIDTTRRTALLENLPIERPLSKEECFEIFGRGDTITGSRIGNFMWATDLDRNRFNFDFDFATDDLSILNAYD
jgi:hypothetical protein